MLKKERENMMPSKLYDALKWVAQILIPALSACYFGLARIWNLPYAEQIVGSLTVVDALLGAILGISSNIYYKEQELISHDEEQ